jgi:hypothetical protein
VQLQTPKSKWILILTTTCLILPMDHTLNKTEILHSRASHSQSALMHWKKSFIMSYWRRCRLKTVFQVRHTTRSTQSQRRLLCKIRCRHKEPEVR